MASEVDEAYRLDISKEYRTEDFLRSHLTLNKLLELQRSDKVPSLPLDNCLGVDTSIFS